MLDQVSGLSMIGAICTSDQLFDVGRSQRRPPADMAEVRPDFENWSDEDFEARADEVCAYVHSLELSEAD